MRTVFEVLHSFLALFCEERKPKSREKDKSSRYLPLRTKKGKDAWDMACDREGSVPDLPEILSSRHTVKPRNFAHKGLRVPFDKSSMDYYSPSKRKQYRRRKFISRLGPNKGLDGYQRLQMSEDGTHRAGVNEERHKFGSKSQVSVDTPEKYIPVLEANIPQSDDDASHVGQLPRKDVSKHNMEAKPKCSRKNFPPPLTSLTMQLYGYDQSVQCLSAYATGYCLHAFRKDGRFVLTEVRAPVYKVFRISREDGRLKVDLLNPVGQLGMEQDLSNGNDNCDEPKTDITDGGRKASDWFGDKNLSGDDDGGMKNVDTHGSISTVADCLVGSGALFEVREEPDIEISRSIDAEISILSQSMVEQSSIVDRFFITPLQDQDSVMVCSVSNSFKKLNMVENCHHQMDCVPCTLCGDISTLCAEQSLQANRLVSTY